MSSRITSLLFGAIATCWVALPSCRPDPVPIELEFPSTETFLYTEIGQLLVFALQPETLGDCPRIVEEVLAGSVRERPVVDTGERTICGFCNGGISVEDFEEGARAFVVVARDASNRPLLAGCTVGEVYEDAPPIVIHLFPTPDYADVVAAGPPPFSDPIRKCGGECQ